MPRSQERAIAYVAMLATGEPADPSWRVTGRYDEQALKRVWHCVARFGTSTMRT